MQDALKPVSKSKMAWLLKMRTHLAAAVEDTREQAVDSVDDNGEFDDALVVLAMRTARVQRELEHHIAKRCVDPVEIERDELLALLERDAAKAAIVEEMKRLGL